MLHAVLPYQYLVSAVCPAICLSFMSCAGLVIALLLGLQSLML